MEDLDSDPELLWPSLVDSARVKWSPQNVLRTEYEQRRQHVRACRRRVPKETTAEVTAISESLH